MNFSRDRRPAHQGAIGVLRDSDNFVNYVFKVILEKLSQLDKLLSMNGSSGIEGSDVILGHLRSIAHVFVGYCVKPNPGT